jgi:transmembrane sensor
MSLRENSAEIDRVAADWVAREDRQALNPSDRQKLATWLDGDVRRRGAYVRAQAAWRLLERGTMLAPAIGADGALKDDGTRRALTTDRRGVLLAAGGALAAGVAAVIGGGLWSSAQNRFGTALGEIRRVPFQDGSNAVINTASLLDVRMQPKRRAVKLLRGEAWFDVAKDKTRPFVVEVGDVRVRAVGTAFSVRRVENTAEIVVTEGVVEVWNVADDAERRRLVAGQSAEVNEQPGTASARAPLLRALSPHEVDQRLAWREGMIDLEGQTLQWAADDFNRYNRRKITIEDSALAAARVDGVFRANDPDSFARAAAAILNADARIGQEEIVLSRRASV